MGRRRRRSRRNDYSDWPRYVPVAERRQKAARKVAALRKKGDEVAPVEIEGRTIARTFWGKSWCANLEAYSDFSNRLPRGRSYVRNGSVIDLKIEPGKVAALVSGSRLYRVKVETDSLPPERWKTLCEECSGEIDSVVELLQGRLSKGVMEVLCRKRTGLFPAPQEISITCSCPDWATMCKHVAATLYGIGARLDQQPELLFVLRQVDEAELIRAAGTGPGFGDPDDDATAGALEGEDLSALFGIELDDEPVVQAAGERIAARELTRTGIRHSAIQYWLRTGVLERSGERGIYVTTSHTHGKMVAYLKRHRA